MYAAQAAGYAPVVRAWDDDAEAILDAAIDVAHAEGIEVGATCAPAVSDAFELADRGDLGEDDTVVRLNTCAGNKDVDTLRSHLGSREEADERDSCV